MEREDPILAWAMVKAPGRREALHYLHETDYGVYIMYPGRNRRIKSNTAKKWSPTRWRISYRPHQEEPYDLGEYRTRRECEVQVADHQRSLRDPHRVQ